MIRHQNKIALDSDLVAQVEELTISHNLLIETVNFLIDVVIQKDLLYIKDGPILVSKNGKFYKVPGAKGELEEVELGIKSNE